MSLELSILTLNVWGIPYVSMDRSIRMNAIGDELATGKYDVVSLQEVWSETDFQLIKKKTENVFPYTHYFYSGVAGSGLCLLSKFPIIATFFHAWSVNGYVHRIQHGDWFGGKGVGLCRILVDHKPINIYVAHLHAEYDIENDDYKAHRVIQAFDTAQFIENTRSDAVLQILAGDLNTEPDDISYKILVQTAKLIDCCKESDQIGTNECSRNSYTSSSALKISLIGKRIDHILIRPEDKYEAIIKDYLLPLPERVPGQTFSYSDHEAVYVKILIDKQYKDIETGSIDICNNNNNNNNNNNINNGSSNHQKDKTIEALQECIKICNSSLKKLRTDRIFYFTMAFFFAFLLFAMIDLLPPYGVKTLYLILKFFLSGIIIFFLFMGTFWNIMEKHAIMSGKLSMEISLEYLQTYTS